MGPFIRSVIALGFAASIVDAGLAQIPAPGAKTPPQDAVVQIAVTVTDLEKHLVAGLTQNDFEVLDNQKPQSIVMFHSAPQTIALMVLLDTSGSDMNSLAGRKSELMEFARQLPAGDTIRVGAFHDAVQFGPRFTHDPAELLADLVKLGSGNATKLWDALVAGTGVFPETDASRALVVVTDGRDTTSHAHAGNVIDGARAANVTVSAIGVASAYFDGQRIVRMKPESGSLRKIVDETGGRYIELQDTAKDLGPALAQIATDLHAAYTIGFAPMQSDGKVHQLTVKMKTPGLTSRARRSYLAPPKPGTPR